MAERDPPGNVIYHETAPIREWKEREEQDPLVGASFGNYLILKKLGEGGMGKVYAAEHPLHGKVAVKVLSENLTNNPDFRKRFFREVISLQKVSHPNIIRYVGADLDNATKNIYLVTEFAEGKGLDDIINGYHTAGKTMPWERAQPISSQICDALAVVHEMKLIHRDLKPGNIMLVNKREQNDLVKLIDFGIARLSENAASKSTMYLTRGRLIMGTPEYMSPEQAQGEKLDHRSDIYSLGIIIYEMVTGSVPFEADTPEKVCIMQATKPPERISKKYPHISLPQGIEEIIMRSLEKEPAKRFQSVREMKIAFSPALERRRDRPAVKQGKMPPLLPVDADKTAKPKGIPPSPPDIYDAAVQSARPSGDIPLQPHQYSVNHGKRAKARDVVELFTREMDKVRTLTLKRWGSKAAIALSACAVLGLGIWSWYSLKGNYSGVPAPTEEVSSKTEEIGPKTEQLIPCLFTSGPIGAHIEYEGNLWGITPLTRSVPKDKLLNVSAGLEGYKQVTSVLPSPLSQAKSDPANPCRYHFTLEKTVMNEPVRNEVNEKKRSEQVVVKELAPKTKKKSFVEALDSYSSGNSEALDDYLSIPSNTEPQPIVTPLPQLAEEQERQEVKPSQPAERPPKKKVKKENSDDAFQRAFGQGAEELKEEEKKKNWENPF